MAARQRSRPAVPLGSLRPLAPAGSGVRAVAEHDIEQDDRVSGSRASCTMRRLRSVGSIIGCSRPWVNSSSPRSTTACPTLRKPVGHAVGLDQRRVAQHRLGQVLEQHLCLVAKGAAGEQAAQRVLARRQFRALGLGQRDQRWSHPLQLAPARRSSWPCRQPAQPRSPRPGSAWSRDRAGLLDGFRLCAEEADDRGLVGFTCARAPSPQRTPRGAWR
jgi:hypothetical protein